MSGPGAERPGRRLDAAFHLLDRQLVDREGALIGKVGDLELSERDDGRLVVTALLLGPGALGPRLPGVAGRAVLAVWRRLHPDADPQPVRVPAAQVSEIGSTVRLAVDARDFAGRALERWAEDRIVRRLPGSSHQSD